MSDLDLKDVIQLHSKNAHLPLAWELAALQLRVAMEILYRRTKKEFSFAQKNMRTRSRIFSLHQVYLMIAGFMLEALMKGVLVHRKSTLKQLMKFGDHNLLNLAKQTGVSLSNEERFFLKRISEFARWIGRYPVPKKPDNMLIKDISGSKVQIGSSNLHKDIQMARSLADRMEALLPEFGKGRHLRTGMRLPSGKSKIR